MTANPIIYSHSNRYKYIMTPRQATSLLFVLFLGIIMTGQVPAYGQRTVVVEPTAFGILNTVIAGDTTATGERTDENTVYVLRRGATYLLSASIENRGYPLTIVAEDGDGPRPILRPGVDLTGQAARAFRLRDDFTIRDVYVTHVNDAGGLQSNMFRISADNVRIVIENCYLDYEQQSFFRIDSDSVKLYIRDTIARNSGLAASPGNGRIIDTRGNIVDTLFVENNTFYNLTNQVLLTGTGVGGLMNYIHFNHNTMYNIGNTALDINRSKEAVVTNNLILNAGFLGDRQEADGEEQVLDPIISIDSLGLPDFPEENRSILIANNNFFFDQEYISLIEATDSVDVLPLFTAIDSVFINAGIATVTGNIIEDVDFTAGPGLVTAYLTDRLTNPANENPPSFAYDPDGANVPGEGSLDFTYSPTFTSNASSLSGQPLGDLNWFGIEIIEVSVDGPGIVPESFKLLGNYPNPFNPTTNVVFELTEPSEVKVTVYDLLGREVLSTFPQQFSGSGTQQIYVDASSLSSGMYLYRVTASSIGREHSFVHDGRMVLLK